MDTINYTNERFFLNAPVPLLVFDVSGAASSGDSSLLAYWIGGTLLQAANQAALRFYQVETLQELQKNMAAVIGSEAVPALKKAAFFLDGGVNRFKIETTNNTLQGQRLDILLHV